MNHSRERSSRYELYLSAPPESTSSALKRPAEDVWSLVGDRSRLPEYSAGLERVDAKTNDRGACTEYTCHFKPRAAGEASIVDRNQGS